MGRSTSAVARYVTYLVLDIYWCFFMWIPLAGSRVASNDIYGNRGRRFLLLGVFHGSSLLLRLLRHAAREP